MRAIKLHESSNADSNAMLNGTFDCNVDTFSFEYHHEPSDAFRMRTGERSPCHSDGTDKNADQTIEKRNNYFITQSNITVKSFLNVLLTWIRICRTNAPFCFNDFLQITH